MKLTIKNYSKLIGQKLPDTDWSVIDVNEMEDFYCFFCRQSDSGYVTSVRLKRDGFMEGWEWKYRFWHPPGHGISQVSTKWFSDMENAKKVIGMELKKL